MHHTFQMLLPVLKLAVFASSIAFLCFVYTIQRIGMARTNVFVNLIPVFTAFLAFILLGERFSYLKVTGIVVVIAGLIFSQVHQTARMSAREK